jgi:hypothetical protein
MNRGGAPRTAGVLQQGISELGNAKVPIAVALLKDRNKESFSCRKLKLAVSNPTGP